jgi:hypothetical protein
MNPTNMNMYLTNSSTVELTESEKISKTALGAYDIAALNQYELIKSAMTRLSSGE